MFYRRYLIKTPNSLLCSSHRERPCDSRPRKGREHEKELGHIKLNLVEETSTIQAKCKEVIMNPYLRAE